MTNSLDPDQAPHLSLVDKELNLKWTFRKKKKSSMRKEVRPDIH